MFWPGEGWNPPGVLAQNALHLNTIVFQTRYLAGSVQFCNTLITKPSHKTNDDELLSGEACTT